MWVFVRPSICLSGRLSLDNIWWKGSLQLKNTKKVKRGHFLLGHFLPINCIKTQLNCYIGPEDMHEDMHITLVRSLQTFNMQLEIRKLLYNLPNTSSHTLINDQLFPKSSFEMLKITVKSPAPYCTSFF